MANQNIPAIQQKAGNVGIGTSDPGSYKLNVNGESAFQDHVTVNSAKYIYTNNIGANSTSTNLVIAGPSSAHTVFTVANVGIGTTSPAYKLDVSGNGRFTYTAGVPALDIRASDTNFALMSILGNQTGDVNWLLMSGYPNAGDFTIRQSDVVNAITIKKTSGNVGIGTTSPTYKFVISNAGATGLEFDPGTLISNRNLLISYNRSTGAYSQIQIDASTTILGTQGNVGIGSTSPGYKLDVSGDINFSSTLKFGGVTVLSNSASDVYANIRVIRNESTSLNDGMYIGYNNSGGTSGHLRFYANGTNERMRIDASNGNVGIGSTSPAYKLDVNGSGRFIFRNSSSEIMDLLLSTESANSLSKLSLLWYGNETAAIKFGRGGDATGGILSFWTQADGGSTTERIRIAGNGNVGIGTTSPSLATLQVNGNVYATSFTGSLSGTASFANNATTASHALSLKGISNNYVPLGNTAGDVSNSVIYQTGGNVGIGTTTPGYKLDVNGITRFQDIVRFKIDAWNKSDDGFNRLYFANGGRTYFGSGNGHEWRSDADAALMVLLNGGSLGIGTTSPAAALDVRGIMRNEVSSNPGNAILFQLTNQTTSSPNGCKIAFDVYNVGAAAIGMPSNSADLVFYANGNSTERMRITSGGALLINQSVSYHGAYLTLNGKLHYSATGGDIGGAIYSTWTQGSNGTEYYAGDLKFQYFTNKGSGYTLYDGMILDGAGRVGIGTTSPTDPLTIGGAQTGLSINSASTGDAYVRWRLDGTIYNDAYVDRGTGNFLIGPTVSSALILKTNNTERMRITSGGNVGIGTTNPTEHLEVYAAAARLSVTGPSGASAILLGNQDSGGANNPAVIYAANGILFFGGGSSWSGGGTFDTSMTILDGGSVGIGTTSPSYKLHVAGDINTTGDIYFNSTSTLRASRRYVSTASLNNSGYTVICNVTGDALASAVRITIQGTADSTVINVTADILVNHFQDILITSQAGIYTVLTLRVISNNNETFSIAATTNSPNTCTCNVEVYPLNSESVTFGGSAQTGATLTHVCRPGINISATGDNDGNFSVSGAGYFGGALGLGAFPGNKLDVYTTTGAAGFNNGISIRTEPGTYTSGHGGMIQFQNEDVITAGIRGVRESGWGSGMAFYVHNTSSGNTFNSTFVERMRINEQGNVGIGSTSPAYLLDVNGTIRATGDVIAYSDARVKDNVTTVENALDKVKSLRGVTYIRKDDDTKTSKVGVIAQEVLPILPEVVQQDTNGNYSVAYGNMVGVLIEAIKEQQRQIDDLKYLLQTINK